MSHRLPSPSQQSRPSIPFTDLLSLPSLLFGHFLFVFNKHTYVYNFIQIWKKLAFYVCWVQNHIFVVLTTIKCFTCYFIVYFLMFMTKCHTLIIRFLRCVLSFLSICMFLAWWVEEMFVYRYKNIHVCFIPPVNWTIYNWEKILLVLWVPPSLILVLTHLLFYC